MQSFTGKTKSMKTTRDEQSRNQLIERFLEGEHEKFDADIADVLAKLKDNNRESIQKRVLGQKDDIEAEVERLPKVIGSGKQYQALGIDGKAELFLNFEKKKKVE